VLSFRDGPLQGCEKKTHEQSYEPSAAGPTVIPAKEV